MTTSMTYARTTGRTTFFAQIAQHIGDSLRFNAAARRKFPSAVAALCVAILLLAGCHNSSPGITVQVQPSSSVSIDEGQSINFTATVANDTQNKGVSWSLAQNTSSTCSGSGCGTLSSTTNSSVKYTAPTGLSAGESVTLTVASVAQPSATTTATIGVVLPPTFTTTTLPNGANGIAYNQPIAVTGGVAPLTFSLQPGQPNTNSGCNPLPLGLTLTTAGTIVGKPTYPTLGISTANTCTFTVLVTDTPTPTTIATPLSVAQSYTISIAPPSVLSINPITLPTATSNTQYSGSISATGGVLPLTWSLASGSLPPGLALSPTTGQISGVVPKFSPPGSTTPTTGTYPFTVQAKDQTLPTSQTATSQTLSITVQAPTTLTFNQSSVPDGTTGTPYSQPLQASGGIPPYTWTITSGLPPSGLSLNSNGILSGTPVLAMTNDKFSVQVQDSEVTPQVTTPQQLTMNVNAGTGNGNSLISGAYSFLFNGFDNAGTVMIAGSITTDGNGTITGGIEDSNRVSSENGGGVITGIPLTGTYSLGTDGRGTMSMVATNPQTSVTLTTDYRIVLDSTGTIHFMQNNDITTAGVGTDTVGTHGGGVMKPVPANFTSGPGFFSGNYSFLFSGQDTNAKPTALGGVLNANGISTLIPAAGGVGGDLNDNGTIDGGSTASGLNISGTFSAGASNNRGTASLLFQVGNLSPTTIQFAFYFVSPSDIFFVEVDQATTAQTPIFYRLSGEMVAQQSNSAFGSGSLTGSSVATGSAANGNNANVLAGLLTSPAAGSPNIPTSVTFGYDENNGGTLAAPSFTGTYVIATNGRVTFSGLGSRAAVAYLTGPGQGFLLGSDANVTTGLLEQQTGVTSFSPSAVQGGYTLSTSFPAETNVPNILGQITGDGSVTGTVQGPLDEILPPTTNNPEGTAVIGASINGHINSVGSNGRGSIIVGSSGSLQFPAALTLYVVSPSHFRAISADSNPGNAHPEVFFFDH